MYYRVLSSAGSRRGVPTDDEDMEGVHVVPWSDGLSDIAVTPQTMSSPHHTQHNTHQHQVSLYSVASTYIGPTCHK